MDELVESVCVCLCVLGYDHEPSLTTPTKTLIGLCKLGCAVHVRTRA